MIPYGYFSAGPTEIIIQKLAGFQILPFLANVQTQRSTNTDPTIGNTNTLLRQPTNVARMASA